MHRGNFIIGAYEKLMTLPQVMDDDVCGEALVAISKVIGPLSCKMPPNSLIFFFYCYKRENGSNVLRNRILYRKNE